MFNFLTALIYEIAFKINFLDCNFTILKICFN